MTIKIYYAHYDAGIWGEEPVSILKKHFSRSDKKNWRGEFRVCPSVKDFYHNVYGIPATYDYHLNISNKEVFSKLRTQQHFNEHVFITDQEKRSIQYGKIYLFTELKSLLATCSYPPFLENTIQHANYITGQMDIGKYPRAMQGSIQFLHDTEWNIKKDDLLWYIKFHTKEKIKFVPFALTQKIMDLYDHGPVQYKNFKLRDKAITSLVPFYDAVKRAGIKKMLFKEIKQNLSGDYA
jgi:hypothetical protein